MHDTFAKLVSHDNDFVGMVAYTIYKRQKIEWLDNFKATHSNTDPTLVELEAGFMSVSTMPSQLDSYREQALLLVNNFLEATLSEKAQDLQNEIQLDAVVKAVTKGFWRGVGENLVTGAIASIVTLAIAGLVWVAAQGPEKLMKDVIKSYFEKATPAQIEKATPAQIEKATPKEVKKVDPPSSLTPTTPQ